VPLGRRNVLVEPEHVVRVVGGLDAREAVVVLAVARAHPLRPLVQQLELSGEDVRLIEDVNADEGVRWVFTFLTADRRRSYCLYEAPSPEAILAAAERSGTPVSAITEVTRAYPAEPVAS